MQYRYGVIHIYWIFVVTLKDQWWQMYERCISVWWIINQNLNNPFPHSDTLFICFITKSFLTYSFFSPIPALSTISRPLSSFMCSIIPETANFSNSYNRMQGPCIGCWFSYRSNCSHWSLTLTFTLTSENPLLITTLTGPYTTMQPTLLTSWLQLLSYKV